MEIIYLPVTQKNKNSNLEILFTNDEKKEQLINSMIAADKSTRSETDQKREFFDLTHYLTSIEDRYEESSKRTSLLIDLHKDFIRPDMKLTIIVTHVSEGDSKRIKHMPRDELIDLGLSKRLIDHTRSVTYSV